MKKLKGANPTQILQKKCDDLAELTSGKYIEVYSIGICAGSYVASGDIDAEIAENILLDTHNKNKERYKDVDAGLANMMNGYQNGLNGDVPGTDIDNKNPLDSISQKIPGLKKLMAYIVKSYGVERNSFTGIVEIDGMPISTPMFNSIRIDMNNVSRDKLDTVLENDKIPLYDPIQRIADTFNKEGDSNPKKRNSVGAIDAYCDCIKSPDQFNYWFKKWFIKMVGSAISTEPLANELVLIFVGKGNVGKTELTKRLLPQGLLKYHSVQAFNFNDPQFERNLTKYMIMCHDDMDNIGPRDMGRFKRLVTLSEITSRVPYEKYTTTAQRRASICGTANHFNLIKDPTGNRRMIGLEIKKIDFVTIDKIDRSAMIHEAINLINKGYEFNTSPEDLERLNNGVVAKYAALDRDEETILEFFAPIKWKSKNSVYMTATQIMRVCEMRGRIKIYNNNFGALMKKHGFVKKNSRNVVGKSGVSTTCYAVKFTQDSHLYDTNE